MVDPIGIQPVDYGLPEKFEHYRPIQWEAVTKVVESQKRVTVLNLPTGAGKSLTAMTLARITNTLGMSVTGLDRMVMAPPGGRTVILTSTLGLMDQYMNDFGPDLGYKFAVQIGAKPHKLKREFLTDVRGARNYKCVSHPGHTCEDGRRLNCRCWLNPALCPHGKARSEASMFPVTVTNYAYWLAANRDKMNRLEVMGRPTTLLILDECHAAPEELSRFLQVKISRRELDDFLLSDELIPDYNLGDWDTWYLHARKMATMLKPDVSAMQNRINKHGPKSTPMTQAMTLAKLRHAESLLDRLNQVAWISGGAQRDNWVLEEDKVRGGVEWTFDCIWPGALAERNLFCLVPKVVMISATARPKTAQLLGLKPDDYDYYEWPRIFPVSRSPVYYVPTAKISINTSESDLQVWVERIDEIISKRLDRKGLIHTVSYSRQQYLVNHSKYARYMICNTQDPDSPTASQAVKSLRLSGPPRILCSPSFGTGWDFPGQDAEYQIISKLPFPNTNTAIAKARKARDKTYSLYVTMQDLVQMCGRCMRSMTDRCETFIVDSNWGGWFRAAANGFAPKWFQVFTKTDVPDPPPRLTSNPTADE
jgi:hypothetical protein